MNREEIIKKVQKAVWDWKNIHADLSEVLNNLKPESEEYKIVNKIIKEENKPVEEANITFPPLLEELKKQLKD